MSIRRAAVVNQLAEEAAELSAASSKLVRKVTFPENVSPKSYEECYKDTLDEIADLIAVLSVFLKDDKDIDYIKKASEMKLNRWRERVKEIGESLD